MLDLKEITIEEFKNNIYDKYVSMFPKEERRDWKKIEITYDNGIEHFYKIMLDDNEIGFIMLEKINNKPYYIDYFAIYKEYQNKGYGSKIIKYLIDNIVLEDGLIGEIEEVREDDIQTVRRLDFYEKLGFKRMDSLYYLYNVYYNPLVYLKNDINKEEIDELLFDYYLVNTSEEEMNKNCKIIK